jgi:phytoene dehydrogenase-like protein
MGTRVAVFGGGVGGLTAAHELVERGFEVAVFDKHPIPGGKARSFGR